MLPHFTNEEIKRLDKGEVFHKENPQLERALLINTCTILLGALKNANIAIGELENIIEERDSMAEDRRFE